MQMEPKLVVLLTYSETFDAKGFDVATPKHLSRLFSYGPFVALLKEM